MPLDNSCIESDLRKSLHFVKHANLFSCRELDEDRYRSHVSAVTMGLLLISRHKAFLNSSVFSSFTPNTKTHWHPPTSGVQWERVQVAITPGSHDSAGVTGIYPLQLMETWHPGGRITLIFYPFPVPCYDACDLFFVSCKTQHWRDGDMRELQLVRSVAIEFEREAEVVKE